MADCIAARRRAAAQPEECQLPWLQHNPQEGDETMPTQEKSPMSSMGTVRTFIKKGT